jgi:glutaredoxin
MTATRTFVDSAVKSGKIVIFTKSYCPYCAKVRKLFDGLGEQYKVYELDHMDNGSDIQQTLEDITSQRTVPNVFINGTHVGGFDKTDELSRSGKLKAMLAQ